MTPEQHRLMRERIGADVAGRLPQEEQLALEEHMAGCRECRAEREALMPVVDALRAVDLERIMGTAPEPSSDLMDRILVRTAGQAAGPRIATSPSSIADDAPVQLARRRRVPLGSTLLALAAAVALLAVGMGIGSQAFPRVAPGAPFETVAFEQAPPGVDASGRLIAHTWGTEIQLIVSGLEDGQEYRATFYGDDGAPIDGGTFIGVNGPMVCNLNAAILRPEVTHLEIATQEGVMILEAELTGPSA